MVSSRAERYLATLERGPDPLPVSTVQTLLLDAGYPCFDAWLEMHDRFAGYIEPLGLDWAVWGIAHADNYYLGPNGVYAEYESAPPDGPEWRVMCAHTHPSNDFELTSTGVFAEKAESFERYVEKISAIEEFLRSGPTRRLYGRDSWQTNELGPQIRSTMSADFIVPDASDVFSTVYASATICIRTHPRGSPDVWIRE